MRKVLSKEFFLQDAVKAAEELLGKYLVRRLDSREELALIINEVEAYDGPEDKANHASKGKTERTEVMFKLGGVFYVYLVYGMHWMLNIVVGEKDYPAAILLRGAGKIIGPARLTKFLGVDKGFNKKEATIDTGLWFEDRGVTVKRESIIRTPRIGVHYAGAEWSEKPYRFRINSDG